MKTKSILMFPFGAFFSFLLIFVIIVTFISCKEQSTDPVIDSKIIKLGAILDLSGDYSETGRAGKAAIELAIEKLNQRYQAVGSKVRFSCTFADTHMDTNLTLSSAKEMYANGIRLLVAGPNNSSELKAIKPFVDANQMLTLCCFSSSPSLSVPNDYVFRIITDDNVQAQALVKMMQYDSIRALIPIWRADTYGNGLYQTVKQKFQNLGGIVLPGVSYEQGATNYQEIISQTATQVSSAIATYGASKVAVILISYQEGVDFLKAAATVNTLSLVKWYGCDANVQKASVTADPAAAQFAHNVRFIAPIMGIGTAGKFPTPAQELTTQIFNKTGLLSDTYSLSAFDAVQIYGLAYDIVQSYNASLIKEILPAVCESYNYLGISRKLNAAGDLASANYIFWTVNPLSGSFSWDSYATYLADGDYILIKE